MKKILMIILSILCLSGCRKYTCPEGYELIGKKCYTNIEENVIIKNTCEEGYKLDNNICKKNIIVEPKTIENCPNGYKKDGSMCILVSTKNASKKVSCEKGTYKDGGCYNFSYSNMVILEKYCPEGYNTEGNKCYKKKKSKPKEGLYGMLECPQGQTLEMGSCIKKIYINKVTKYGCISGTLKGEKCEVATWVGVPKVEYSCPKGYNLIGTKCSKTDVTNILTKYSCEEGFEISNDNKCKKVLSQESKKMIVCDNDLELKNNKCIGKKIIRAEKR